MIAGKSMDQEICLILSIEPPRSSLLWRFRRSRNCADSPSTLTRAPSERSSQKKDSSRNQPGARIRTQLNGMVHFRGKWVNCTKLVAEYAWGLARAWAAVAALLCVPRHSKALVDWIRLALLLAGDVEPNPGPRQRRAKSSLFWKHKETKNKVHFATLMDVCHLKNAELQPKVQRQSRALRSRRRLWSLRIFYWTGLLCVPGDCRNNHGCHWQIERLWRTSIWCSICLFSGKIGGCSQISEKSQIGMSRCLDASSTTQMAKIMQKRWRLCDTSWTKLGRSPISWIAMGDTIRRSFVKTWMGGSAELGMYVRSSETRVVSVSICGWPQKWLERSRKWIPCGRNWKMRIPLFRSNYRRYSFILNRKRYGGRKITGVTGVTVDTVFHKNVLCGVGCKKWHYVRGSRIQAFTFSSQDHGRLSGVWFVLWWCVCCCVVVVRVCGVWWSLAHTLSLLFSLLPLLGTFIATANELHGMFPPLLLPPLLASLLPPSHTQKKEGPFHYRNISGEEFIFYYSFK